VKLDRLVAKHRSLGRTGAQRAIATGRVRVAGEIVVDGHHPVDRYDHVSLDDETLQEGMPALYVMLHKPAGILSATSDPEHPTVIDLIDHPLRATLHLAGRLDRASSGLVLLTNDGRWSKKLTAPGEKVAKVYLVETAEPIAPEAVEAFARGFYFHTEDLTTLPAQLEILAPRQARVTLHEGRYHQIKRMFHRVNNRVTSLHRESVGPYTLPGDLAPGAWRLLTLDD
jgi:16S rRNA pseudouridine516 synthase